MSKNMAHIKLLAFKENESHYSEIVVSDIKDIMFIQILKVVERRKQLFKCIRRGTIALFNDSPQKKEFLLMLRKESYRIKNSLQ